MTARSSFESSVAAAGKTQIATSIAATTTFQETINASGCDVGYNNATGNNANLLAAVKNANAALQATRLSAEQIKQASLAAARETLRATGDVGPV